MAAFRKLRMILIRSHHAGWIASLFILGLLMLMALLWYQIRTASNIELPVDQQRISSMMGSMAVPGKDSREVVILNSYHLGYSWSDNEMRGIVEMLMKADARIQPLIDFLDCKHHPTMGHFDRLRDLSEFPLGIRDHRSAPSRVWRGGRCIRGRRIPPLPRSLFPFSGPDPVFACMGKRE